MKSLISSHVEVEEILRGLGERLAEPVQFLVIGGAAMLEYGLKDFTKDIDLVCRDASGKTRLLGAAKSLGFEVFGPEKRHARLGLDRVAIKGGHTLDIFAGRVSYDFGLSEAMWQRGRTTRTLGKAEMRYAAVEDIFILKLIANRPKISRTAFPWHQRNWIMRRCTPRFRLNMPRPGLLRKRSGSLTWKRASGSWKRTTEYRCPLRTGFRSWPMSIGRGCIGS